MSCWCCFAAYGRDLVSVSLEPLCLASLLPPVRLLVLQNFAFPLLATPLGTSEVGAFKPRARLLVFRF